jgi:hypothetical protein
MALVAAEPSCRNEPDQRQWHTDGTSPVSRGRSNPSSHSNTSSSTVRTCPYRSWGLGLIPIPKLNMRVRFSSPAPLRSLHTPRRAGFSCRRPELLVARIGRRDPTDRQAGCVVRAMGGLRRRRPRTRRWETGRRNESRAGSAQPACRTKRACMPSKCRMEPAFGDAAD